MRGRGVPFNGYPPISKGDEYVKNFIEVKRGNLIGFSR